MMKKTNVLLLLALFCISITTYAAKKKINKLGKPQIIKGESGPLKIEAYGYAHPAVYDWNKDGKKDLIVGEFEAKAKFRVYLNIGSDSKPKFNDDFFYGKDIDGNPLFVETG